ncbi:cordon-bleu protein-like 1 [Cottoperca gobio]|uniref:Cordon-bleu protein-like 1 n=1 Tax=Cottoperca gobio TaxID=56716 RepID=A0A6J2QTF9_COTGO|nr:cordon-bleu protein-like 1 [Cottoperca gobio]
MDEQENPLDRDFSLSVVLPGGLEKNATVHGSKPVIDLLVTLCASYHLNPSDYTVEVLSPNKNNISFKPNSPIGSLEAESIVLKPKGMEEKIRRPYMPEASVRLLINYNKSHKTVVRVNPRVPLEMLLPAVCDKCELQVETTVLLRDSQSVEPLDLSKTLNEHGLREVFAKDTAAKEPDHQHQDAAVSPTEVISPPPLQDVPKKEKKQKDTAGFLSLFRRRKKKAEMEGARSAPASPTSNKHVGVSMNVRGVSSSSTLPADMPKRRRAPQPPMGASQSIPNNLGTCHVGESQRSAESTLRSTKRRAPPPPCANIHQEVKATADSLNTVEELREINESVSVNLSLPSSSSPHPRSSSFSSRPSFAHLHDVADPYLPSFRGKDFSDARCALAKVLTSSISKGALVKRLRNSATFPKFNNGSSFMSSTPRCSDNGVFFAELESVLTSNHPTEDEWEDPVQRKGMTTFKVVPPMKEKCHDPELTTGQITVEDNPESEEDPCSPDTSENETPLQSPEPSQTSLQSPEPSQTPLQSPEPSQTSLQSPEPSQTPLQSPEPSQTSLQSPEPSQTPLQSPEPSQTSLQSPEPSQTPLQSPEPSQTPFQSPEPSSQESQASDRPSSPPPLRDLNDQDSPGSPLSEVKNQTEEDKPEVTSEVTLAAPSDFPDGELPSDGQSLQSPSGPSESTDMDHEPYTEMEEKVVQEEEGVEDCFPPPPPPVFFDENIEVMEERGDSSQPTSPSSNGRADSFSEDRHNEPAESTAAPTPLDETSAAPSRFAEAVALAVQRSRLQSPGKGLDPQAPSGPHGTLPSPSRSTYQHGA